MNILLVIGTVALVAFVVALILSHDFRHWIGDNLTALGSLIADAIPVIGDWLRDAFNLVRRVISIYALILLITAIVALVLMAIALLMHWPTGSAFLFVLAICLVILAWLPAGIILRLFKVTDAVVPCALRALIAWIAFVGWLCLMAPDVITMKSLLGAALVGFIFFGTAVKINALEKLIAPLVIVMCLWVAWSYFWPESFRSTTRFVESTAKWVQTKKDSRSINSETDAATTYAQTLRDISALYTLEKNSKGKRDSLVDVEMDSVITTGTILKLVNRRAEVKVIDNQGFVEIQLPNKKGNFVTGKKFYVEAEYIQIASPRDVTPKNPDLIVNRNSQNSQSNVSVSKVGGIFPVGKYSLALKEGEESDWCTIEKCHAFTFVKSATSRVTLTYEDGTTANSWDPGKWPNKFKFKVKNLNKEMPILQVM